MVPGQPEVGCLFFCLKIKPKKFRTFKNLKVTRLQVQKFPDLVYRDPSPRDVRGVPMYDYVVWLDRPKF